MNLEDVKQIFKKFFVFDDYDIIDVFLATIVANMLEIEDPVNLQMVGPSSVGKTTIIRSAEDLPFVYDIDTVTTKSFFSGHSKKDSSLIPRLTKEGKFIILIKDFSNIISMRLDTQQEIIGQIRSISDGRYKRSFGTGEEVVWQGKMAFISGITGTIDKYHRINSMLGERFIYFRIKNVDNGVEEKVFGGSETRDEVRQELNSAVVDFILDKQKEIKLLNENSFAIGQSVVSTLGNMARFVSRARSYTIRDRHGTLISTPESEGIGRFSSQLKSLIKGLTIIHGSKEDDGIYHVTPKIFDIVKKICWSSIPSIRRELLDVFLKSDKELTSDEIAERSYPFSSIRRQLEDMVILKILERKEKSLTYVWWISEEFQRLLRNLL